MSQQYVDSYFNNRKRTAAEDVRSRAKVLVLDEAQASSLSNNSDDSKIGAKSGSDNLGRLTPQLQDSDPKISPKIVFASTKDPASSKEQGQLCDGETRNVLRPNRVVRNIQFDSPKSGAAKTPKTNLRGIRGKRAAASESQPDIRETFFNLRKGMGEGSSGAKQKSNVLFEKKGPLSPTKKVGVGSQQICDIQKVTNTMTVERRNEEPAAGSVTPKKLSTMDFLAQNELSIGQIKKKITRSSKLAALKASMAKINKCAEKLDEIEASKKNDEPKIQKFGHIEIEVPISPQKALLSPRKNAVLPSNASPQRRLLFSPKKSSPSPVKSSPTKQPAYERHQALAESGTLALPLPYNYRFLAEVFRSIDTVASMLFNRKEVITFKKLKPAVQEMLRRNFTLDHLAQIKTVYPNAFIFNQEKLHSFGSSSKQDKYELVITPLVEQKNGRSSPDANNIIKSASEMSMCPAVMLERRRIFYNTLIDLVKDHHEKFLLGLDPPMNISKDKILNWHPKFDVETCPAIGKSELPQPPNVEKLMTAGDVLQRAKSLFNCNTRMEKALQRLADAKMTSKSASQNSSPTIVDATTQITADDELRKVQISIVDTPPATPTVAPRSHLSSIFKGIPKALLEKVREKQAAKALEAMTRTPTANKEATQYSRLPELAKILRNIFIVEKKAVLSMEFVINKVDNSYRAKLTPNELEDHIKLICKLLPTWSSIHNVRKVDYLKLAKNVDINKVVRRLEIMANDKVTSS